MNNNISKNKKILIIFPLLPKYDVEFFEKFTLISDYDLHVTANIKNKNDLTLSDYGDYKFHVHHTDIKKIGPFDITFGLDKLILEINPDLIIYTASPRDLGQMFSIIKNKFFGKKIAVWSMFHRIGGPMLYSSLYYKFLGFICDKNMAYTNTGKQYQIARGVDATKIDVIGTAIDEEKVFSVIEKLKYNKSDLKKKYNLDGKFVLLQVLRLTSIKKPHFLIDMMKLLIEKDTNSMLVLIGGGVLENEIKEYVTSHGLDQNVLFLGPIYDEIILNDWFTLADVFVIPTCIGLSAHHACCYGLPIITDDSLVNQASEFDILQDRLNCLLYKEGSLSSFVDKILELKNNKDLYDRISTNALVTVKDINTLSVKATNLKTSIENLFLHRKKS